MASFSQSGRFMSVKFAQLGDDDLLLAKLTGTEGVSELFSFELELLSPSILPIAFDKVLGQEACVSLQLSGGGQRYIHGIVSRFEQGVTVPGPNGVETFVRYYAELVPHFWLLTKRVQSRVYRQKTVPDIVALALTDQVPFDKSLLRGEYPARDHCIQYQESNFAFVSRLLESEGIYYYFRHEANKDTLVLADNTEGYVDVPGPTSVTLWLWTGPMLNPDFVDGWRKGQALASGKYTCWDYSAFLADQNLSGEQSIPQTVKIGMVDHSLRLAQNVDNWTLFDYPAGYAGYYDPVTSSGTTNSDWPSNNLQKDRTRIPPLRIGAEAVASIACTGTGTCKQFTPGGKFTLNTGTSLAMATFAGEYVLTEVSHTASVEESYTGAPPGTTPSDQPYRNEFVCIPSALGYRPERRTPRPIIAGLHPAVVVGVTNYDVFADGLGRVRIQFYWDQWGLKDLKNAKGDAILTLNYWQNQQSDSANGACWARVAQSWADRSFGTFFTPRMGQEVVVAFVDGDPDRPMVVGCVYNSVNNPPFPGAPLVTGIKTHIAGQDATQFSGLAFDDTPGSGSTPKVTTVLQSQGQLVFNVKSDMVLNINGNFIINLSGNQRINQGSFPS
jgi:type VI secretion system secreted protein VgrG